MDYRASQQEYRVDYFEHTAFTTHVTTTCIILAASQNTRLHQQRKRDRTSWQLLGVYFLLPLESQAVLCYWDPLCWDFHPFLRLLDFSGRTASKKNLLTSSKQLSGVFGRPFGDFSSFSRNKFQGFNFSFLFCIKCHISRFVVVFLFQIAICLFDKDSFVSFVYFVPDMCQPTHRTDTEILFHRRKSAKSE